jgi:hypothetical protein
VFHEALLSACTNEWYCRRGGCCTRSKFATGTNQIAAGVRDQSKSDYAAFLDRVLARDTDAAVAACVENHAKMADFVESTVNRSAEGKHRSRMAARS